MQLTSYIWYEKWYIQWYIDAKYNWKCQYIYLIRSVYMLRKMINTLIQNIIGNVNINIWLASYTQYTYTMIWNMIYTLI